MGLTQLNFRRHRKKARKQDSKRIREPYRSNPKLSLLFNPFSVLFVYYFGVFLIDPIENVDARVKVSIQCKRGRIIHGYVLGQTTACTLDADQNEYKEHGGGVVGSE